MIINYLLAASGVIMLATAAIELWKSRQSKTPHRAYIRAALDVLVAIGAFVLTYLSVAASVDALLLGGLLLAFLCIPLFVAARNEDGSFDRLSLFTTGLLLVNALWQVWRGFQG